MSSGIVLSDSYKILTTGHWVSHSPGVSGWGPEPILDPYEEEQRILEENLREIEKMSLEEQVNE